MRKALPVALALFLSACGVVGGQGPYVPPVGPDMAESEVKLVQVPAGPDSSGSDVRLLWVKTARPNLITEMESHTLAQHTSAAQGERDNSEHQTRNKAATETAEFRFHW